MNAFTQINQFHKTRFGYAVFGLVELGLAYVFASLAIDSGNLWLYLLLLIFLVGGLQNIVKLVNNVIHGHK
ncbi:MAG TPA: hypothetical protein VHD60_01375 [Candidatus Saccharimonadales bacterium]|nr:hypothetical protein [Candidatus Saccharimonadales bacterium]